MITDEPISFIDYWEAVDAAMLKFFGIDTGDAGIGAGVGRDWAARRSARADGRLVGSSAGRYLSPGCGANPHAVEGPVHKGD